MQTTLFFSLFFLSFRLLAAAPQPVIITAGADPWPPYIDEHHPHGGVSVQLANAALKTQDYEVQNKIMPWARALEETRAGRVDAILDAWWTQERSQDFMFSRPYLDGPVKFIKRLDSGFEYNGLSSLRGKTIAVVRDYGYDEQFLKANDYTLFEVTEFTQGISMLVKHRVDLAIENELVAKTRIRASLPESYKHIAFSRTPLSNNYLYVVSGYKNPNHTAIINAFNQGLKAILANGVYEQILAKEGLPMPEMFQPQTE